MSVLWLASSAGAEVPAQQNAQLDAYSRAKQLSDLRAEIESLERNLDAEQALALDDERALRSRVRELEAAVSAERARAQALEATVAAREAERATRTAEHSKLAQLAQGAATALIERIDRSIPFQKSARGEVVRGILRNLTSGVLTPVAALEQLAGAIEDELRLCSDLGMMTEVTTVAGAEVLAEVAHLGCAVVAFRSPGGASGFAFAGDTALTPATAPAERAAAARLVDALESPAAPGPVLVPLRGVE
jgi:hypothetical protein